jgi:hypothetical protein
VLEQIAEVYEGALWAWSGNLSRVEVRILPEEAREWPITTHEYVLVPGPVAAQISDEQIGGLIRGERIGWPRLRSAVAQAAPRLPTAGATPLLR